MPTPADNSAVQQQLLYEIPDDQSSTHPQPVINDTERWNVIRSNGAEPKIPNRRTESRRNKSKFQFCCACLLFALTVAMLVFGVLLGSVIFYKLYGKCSKELPVEVEPLELTTEQQVNAECGLMFPWKKIRLPTDLRPTRYKLWLHPNLTTFESPGSVEIDIEVVKETNLVIIHQQNLNITYFSLRVDSQSVSARLAVCEFLNQWAFVLDRKLLPEQRVKMKIEFSAAIPQAMMAGFYANYHVDHEKNEKTVSAVTQFEPTHARRAFPCYDEPNFKAIFEVSIVRDPEHEVRANMHLERSEVYDVNYMIDHFAPTIRMPTYILAFAVLDGFNKVRRMTRNTKRPIEVNVFAATKNYAEQSEFALSTAVRALEFFEVFFDIPFPLQKTDLLALDDFAEGAMENSGLMTFRDILLLYEKDKSTERNLEQVALVVCHEVAHQWFGNYVTMQWWNDLWLNEGFANYMEFLCVDKLYPDWDVLSDFFLENTINSLGVDGFLTSHSISTDLEDQDPMQVSSIFDVISYNKGAAVLQMIRSLIGPDRFQASLQTYLKTYAYSNAKSEDLWRAIQSNILLNVNLQFTTFAEEWTTKVGYPMISVSINEEGTRMILHNQTRFLYLEASRTENTSNTWPVPMQIRSNIAKVPRLVWLLNKTEIVELGSIRSSWIIANADSQGFYRVLYSKQIYKELAKQLMLNHHALSTIERASVINDMFAFLKAGYLDVDTVFDLIQYVADGEEAGRAPWALIMGGLWNIEIMVFENTNLLKMLEKFERHLILKSYEKLSWDKPATHSERIIQPEILAMACRLQIDDCTRRATQKFYQWLQNKTAVHIDLLPLILEEGVRRGTPSDWEQIFQYYLQSRSPNEKQIYLVSLAATTDIKIINRLLELCLDNNVIRQNLIPRVIGSLMLNRAAAFSVWHFCRQNFIKLEKALGESTMLGTLLKAIIEQFSTQFDLDEVVTHFDKLYMGGSRARYEQALESIKLNIQWRQLNEKALQQWLKQWHVKNDTD
ncbi:Aminopeptidase [Aphelenchoides bicaudatus]|nr:Aminopeptidase [Aphelenchoides bicaudatus]